MGRGWLIGVTSVWCVALASAEATPPTRQATTILRMDAEYAGTAQAALEWLRAHAQELREQLAKTAPRYAQMHFLLEHATIEKRAWQGDESWVVGATELLVVSIPMVKPGTAWVVENGRVVVGYQRPHDQFVEAVRLDEESMGGQQVMRTKRSTRSESQYEPQSAHDSRDPTDEPVFAEILHVLVDHEGRIYY